MDELRDVISSKELQDNDLKRGITQAGVGAMWYDTPNMLGKFSTASVLRMIGSSRECSSNKVSSKN